MARPASPLLRPSRRRFLAAAAAAVLVACGDNSRSPSRLKIVATIGEGPYERRPRGAAEEARERLGWIEGKTMEIHSFNAMRPDELPELASKIVALKPDVVIALSTRSALAMKRATSTIPVLFLVAQDPIESGLVASLAHPGGNLTGVYNGLFNAKQLEILKEILPLARVVAFPVKAFDGATMERAGTLGLELRAIPLTGEQDLDGFFQTLARVRPDAVVVPPHPWLRQPIIETIVAELLRLRVPSIGPYRQYAEAGGLASFSPKLASAPLVVKFDQILRGAKPGDLPVETPKEFELVVNTKTAAALRVTIPSAILLRAELVS